MNLIFLIVIALYIVPLFFKRYRKNVFYAELVLGLLLIAYLFRLSNSGEHFFTILIILLAGVFIIPCISRLIFKRGSQRLLWLLGALLIAGASWYALKSSADDISHLIQEGKGSITYIDNNKVELSRNGDRAQPLASVVKVIVALEYAEQVADKRIDPEEKVDYKDIQKYYLPNTDGGAQAGFEHEYDTKDITVNDVAKGMIKFSSNANTDYLMDRLGLDNINHRLQLLKLSHHTKVYPLVGGMILASETDTKNFNKKMDDDTLVQKAVQYKDDYINGKLKQKTVLKHLDMQHQEYWSDHLTHGSTSDYADLMNRINNNQLGAKQTAVLRTLLEQNKSDEIKEKYTHYGYKGGSTAKVLNGAYYMTVKKDKTTQSLAFFLDDLNMWESYKAQKSMKAFRDKVLEDQSFRDHLKK